MLFTDLALWEIALWSNRRNSFPLAPAKDLQIGYLISPYICHLYGCHSHPVKSAFLSILLPDKIMNDPPEKWLCSGTQQSANHSQGVRQNRH